MNKIMERVGQGYVALISSMGDDLAVAETARMSTGAPAAEPAWPREDRRLQVRDARLLDHMLTHTHTSPFEFDAMIVEIRAPKFVFDHFVRHRTAPFSSFSVESRRYRPETPEMWQPTLADMRGAQSESQALLALGGFDFHTRHASIEYEAMLALGVHAEVARAVLPVAQMVRWRQRFDLHNLMHFLSLRTAPDAQKETRDFANALCNIAAFTFPFIISYTLDTTKHPSVLGPQAVLRCAAHGQAHDWVSAYLNLRPWASKRSLQRRVEDARLPKDLTEPILFDIENRIYMDKDAYLTACED